MNHSIFFRQGERMMGHTIDTPITRAQRTVYHYLITLCVACILTWLAACTAENSSNTAGSTVDDAALLALVKAAGLTGDPTRGRSLPSIDDPKAQLGKQLFFTQGLGGDSDSACVTCHHPALGGGDNLSLSIGVGAEIPELLGPGRHHDSVAIHFDGVDAHQLAIIEDEFLA
jgi:hypothetical protein